MENQGAQDRNPANGRSVTMETPSAQSQRQYSVSTIKFADDYLNRWDKNRDGKVAWSEASEVIRDYSFRSLDVDGDRFITRTELLDAAESRRGR
jgi:hypothetical protein